MIYPNKLPCFPAIQIPKLDKSDVPRLVATRKHRILSKIFHIETTRGAATDQGIELLGMFLI